MHRSLVSCSFFIRRSRLNARFSITRRAIGCFCAVAGLLSSLPAFAQAPPNVQPLWDKLSEVWSNNDIVAAEAVSDELVEALKPVETDFQWGIQANSAIHNRASLRYNLGDYAGAEADLIRSVEQAKAIQMPGGAAIPAFQEMIDVRIRLSLRGLMNFYLAAGDLERATTAFREAVQIVPAHRREAQNTAGSGYRILASEVSSMEGTFYRATGDYVKSLESFLAYLEEMDVAWQGVLKDNGGQESDFTDQLKMNYLRGRANVLMEMAEVASLQGDHEEAVGFAREAREAANGMMPLYRNWAENVVKTNPAMKQETVDKTLQGVETNMNYLRFERSALIFRAAGDEKGALELMLEGLAKRGTDFKQQRMLTLEYNVIRPEESLRLIGDLQAILGKHDEASASYEKALTLIQEQYPGDHPAALEIRESQALLSLARGDRDEAAERASALLADRMKNLETVLSFGDESQRLAYRSSIDPWSLQATIGEPGALYEAVLRTKGIVLESILEDQGLAQKENDPALAETLAQLEQARRDLMKELLAGADPAGTEEKRKVIAGLEAKLGRRDSHAGARKSLTVTIDAVAGAIPADGVLIEFIRYRDFSAPGRFVEHFGAVVLAAGGQPEFVSLAEASKVDAAMDAYANSVRAKTNDEDMSKLLAGIGELVWKPIEPHLPAAGKPLILSPDGSLNFFSFATLLGDGGQFIGEIWPVTYVSSGRDLLREKNAERNESIQIVANPDFQTPTTEEVAGAREVGADAAVSMRGVLGRIGLSPLPGTKAEEEALRKIIEQEWKWKIESHLERGATEEAVGAVDSPGILHLATHGFYLPQTGRSDPLERAQRYWDSAEMGSQAAAVLESFSDVVLNNPMHRSGIALAGAEATLHSWGEGKILDTRKDGILTAAEMAGLDLEGTWMVVLSACETGLGEARSGEGVLGMRRGLARAGAEHLLLTLWPVADRETALFMMDFYQNLDAGKNEPVDVAPAIQSAYLKAFREKQGVAAAVRLAGPFILSR
ncbi:MAG: CHAT domain-containing protein [Verrucomicrobiales bacterium]|nr:CHAT domain-containing protein [Verrucomicrobiales bacterium]